MPHERRIPDVDEYGLVIAFGVQRSGKEKTDGFGCCRARFFVE